MDSLRVDSGIKNIEVNDNGEYISIPVSDAGFFEKFADLIRSFENKQEEIEKQAKELSEKHKDEEENSVDAIIDSVKLYSELCQYTCTELDKLFGEGSCKKIFVGNSIPGIELIMDFFKQITPFLQKYAQERNQRINLIYNRNRKGARSK